MSAVFRSYLKTTLACSGLLLVASLSTTAALLWLPTVTAAVVGFLGALVVLGAGVLTCACLLVIVRHRNDERGKRDLFLELNRSREPGAIETGRLRHSGRLRRWLARLTLGNDLIVGDLVEIKSWPEIKATLDANGCLGQLPFMPEMLRMCGQRAYVFKNAHRIFDYRKSRRMRHLHDGVLLVAAVCDGSSHGGCEAACHTIWKSAWLRRIEHDEPARVEIAAGASVSIQDIDVLQFGTRPPRFLCQLTQLQTASQPVDRWSIVNFLRPLICGNVTASAFAVGWLTHLFNELQHFRQGIVFPTFAGTTEHPPQDELPLQPGDRVRVRSAAEIRATLDDRFVNRGMGFEFDMLKYCGRRCQVEAEVRRLIDIVTGETRTMKTPAYRLRGTHFSGERQLFNSQYEPLFWRSAWLRRDEA